MKELVINLISFSVLLEWFVRVSNLRGSFFPYFSGFLQHGRDNDLSALGLPNYYRIIRRQVRFKFRLV